MTLREVRVEDYEAVARVLVRNGLRTPNAEQWRHFWHGAPHTNGGVPFGWVLEHDAAVVGAFRNVSYAFEWNGRPVRVVVASAWAVDAALRRGSLMLAAQYFRQRGVDVLLNMTAVEATSGKAFLAFGAEKVPQADYMSRLLWIVDYARFAAKSIGDRGVPASRLLGYPAGLVLWAADRWRRASAVPAAGAASRVDRFDSRFDAFWSRVRRRDDRLQAVRDAAALTWRFAIEREQPLVVVFEQGRDMIGYAVLVRRDDRGLRRMEVADLQAIDDAPAVVCAVMQAAIGEAARDGIDVIGLTGHNAAKRRALAALGPHVKTAPGWPLYYKAIDVSLTEPLRHASAWDLSLYDSDALWSGVFLDEVA
jgi:hypothetical protein